MPLKRTQRLTVCGPLLGAVGSARNGLGSVTGLEMVESQGPSLPSASLGA